MSKQARETLKGFFTKGSIPSQGNFEDLIDSAINQIDDGISNQIDNGKSNEPKNPLRINGSGADGAVLKFYQNVNDPKPAWALSLTAHDPANPQTPKLGWNVSDGEGISQLFIDGKSGHVGIRTSDPQDLLDVAGGFRILTGYNPVRFTTAWSKFADAARNQAEISNDTDEYKSLMIAGNSSQGEKIFWGDWFERRVSVWDRLDVNGELFLRLAVPPVREASDLHWDNSDHPVYQYFKNRLSGLPVGTTLLAKGDPTVPDWTTVVFFGWVGSDKHTYLSYIRLGGDSTKTWARIS